MQSDGDKIQLGANLKQLIDDGGYRRNRRKFASAIGVSEGAVSQYVTDQTRPTLENLVKIATLFNVSLDRLVYGPGHERPITPQTDTISDVGPFAAYLDHSLANVQKRLAAQTSLTRHLGERIAEDIARHAEHLAQNHRGFAGMLADDDTLAVEAHSLDTLIVSMDLAYEVITTGDQEIPGRFLPIVANNIKAGRRYRYLLPKDSQDWSEVANTLRKMLANITASPLSPDLFQIRQVADSVYTSIGMLTVDTNSLEKANKTLYELVHPYLGPDGELTYVIPASKDQLGDSLMDAKTQHAARRAIEAIWARAEQL